MTRVKICGLRDPETAVAAAKAGADFIGLVFAESKRRVTPQQCYDIIEALNAERRTPPPAEFEGPIAGEVRGLSWLGAWSDAIDQAIARWRPLIVGVFAGMDADEVNDIAATAGLDIVQLSGDEPAGFVRNIQHPVIRTIHVAPESTAEDIFEVIAEVPTAGIHLDTGGKGALGGTGQAFDWDVAAAVARRAPIMLAGGLAPENVAAAVGQVEPWAVDVSSGVETGGSKDIEKIRAFIRAAKGVRVGR
ncbi:MAG: phosphoribosylanthranilate isomerase [Chloroflexi bacterium]|nr:phosphoribosylanthranilate isomerase [Chloroflexota bacterium]